MRIAAFVLELIFQWLVGAALLRAWMNALRVNMRVQPGLFVMALTDWIVKPLRRWLPQPVAKARIDWGSVLSAVLLSILYAIAWRSLMGAWSLGLPWLGALAGWPGMALIFLVRTAIQVLSVLLLGAVLVSWLQTGSPLHVMLSRLTAPWLAPIRSLLPPIGGVDLSPLVLLLLLQVAAVLLG